MKKILITSALLLIILSYLNAQDVSDTVEISLDMLRAPSSPAANLLGISNSDIQKPSDKTEFMALVRGETNGLKELPSSLALDYSPLKKSITDFEKNEFKSNFKQSFTLSLGTQRLDSGKNDVKQTTQQFAFGLKFSIKRGELNSGFVKNLKNIQEIKTNLINPLDILLKSISSSDQTIIDLKIELKKHPIESEEAKKIRDKIAKRDEELIGEVEAYLSDKLENKQLKDKLDKEYKKYVTDFTQIKKIVEGIKYDRYGFKWDVSAGIMYDFTDLNNFSSGNFNKMGIWTTLGHEDKDGWSLLFLLRYLYNPDKIYADDNKVNTMSNISTYDMGGRFIVGTKGKISVSAESIYRYASVKELDPTWRFTLNAAYAIGNNQQLTFAYGKDFDGAISKEGNVIAAINYVIGLGSNIKVK